MALRSENKCHWRSLWSVCSAAELPPPPPPPPPRRCLLFLLCNWDAETLTELIYCDGELCNVEGNADYYINVHTHKKQTDTHMLVGENVIWHHAGEPLQLFCTCGLMQPGAGTEVKTCWVIASDTVASLSECAQVFIMRSAHQHGCEGLPIEMGLLCCLVLSLSQQIRHLNRKMTNKKLQSKRFICVKMLRNLLSLLSVSLFLFFLHHDDKRRWFILLRQRTSLTHTWTHSQHTPIHKSTKVCCHTPLINS